MAKNHPKKAAPKKRNQSAPTRKLRLPNDEPLYLDMTFEEALKLALNTPIKKSKINKK